MGLTATEKRLWDNPESTKVQYVEKLEELENTGSPIVWRFKEDSIRGDWITALSGTIGNYRTAAADGDKYGHIAGEKIAAQSNLPKDVKPVLICADMEKKNAELAKMADEILKEPKPAPPKEEKKGGSEGRGNRTFA